MNTHKISGGGPMHAWDCPPCVKSNEERKKRDTEENPHRYGTKAYAKRAGSDTQVRMAMDPRTETYWSL